MLKTEKERVVAELVERLQTAETLIVADYRGLTHAELDGVRTQLLQHGARLSVCKNTLTRIAAQEAGVEPLLELLTGPTAIAFVHDGDMVAVAKTLSETARTTRRLDLKGGVLQGRAIGADAVRDLATLPPVDVLQGQVLGAIVAPLTSLLGLVTAPLTNLAGLIDARIEQLQAAGDGGAAPATAEAPAEDTQADDAAPEAEAETAAEPDAASEPEATAAVEPEAGDDVAPEDATSEEPQNEEEQ
jgi:large subunit ribosomal protein L10